MAERAFPFTTTGSGGNTEAYTEAQTAEFFQSLFTQDATYGVLRDYLNELVVSTSSGNIAVATGSAFVKGYWYLNNTSKSITVATPTLGTTGYRVILRLDYTANTITAEVLSSSDGVSALPALTQNSSIWEETLTTFTKTTGGVVTLTDARTFAQYSTNHVKRNGDTVTGALTLNSSLTVESALPSIILIESDAATDNKRWQLIVTGESFRVQLATDAGSASSFITVDRTGNTVDSINIASTALTHNNNDVWTRDNLDIRRQGGNASDWSVPGTTNYMPTTYTRQIGVCSNPNLPNTTNVLKTITFPVAFTQVPFVMLDANDGSFFGATVNVDSVSLTQVVLSFDLTSGSLSAGVFNVRWSAESIS
jgi:hypothetical protein